MKHLFNVTFRGQTVQVESENPAKAGAAGIRKLGFEPRKVGQHNLEVKLVK